MRRKRERKSGRIIDREKYTEKENFAYNSRVRGSSTVPLILKRAIFCWMIGIKVRKMRERLRALLHRTVHDERTLLIELFKVTHA